MGEKLNRVRDAHAEYKRLIAKVEELDAIATRVTPVLSDMPKGGSSQMDDKWARLIDYKQKLNDKLNEYLDNCAQLEEELGCIRNPKIRTAMKCRYVDCLTVEETADMIESDERYTYRLLKTGKKIYEEVYEDRE